MEHRPVVIIGAGPAGLTAAYVLSKAGVRSIVLEKDQTVGGLARTVNYKGYYFDTGGHRFFTKVESVENIWKEVLGEDLLQRNRLSRIYYNKKFFYYPLRPLNALLGLGGWNSILILYSYLTAQLFPSKDEETFEDWVSNRFGKRLFKIFFKTYTEKVWGISCNDISAEWAAQRVKGLSLMTALKNAIIKNRNEQRDKKKVIKTLIDEFDYPKLGPGMMWQALVDILQRTGSQVWLGSEVEGIRWSRNKVEALEVKRNGQTEFLYGSDFISSMPIREALQRFKPAVPKDVLDAANDLKYRDFLTVALIIRKPMLFPDTWIYIHDPNVKVGRIQNFKNWSPFMVPDPNNTCLGLEYFCYEGDELWNLPDDELREVGKRELEILGLANKNDVQEGTVVRMPKAYPIYDLTYRKSLEVVRQFLKPLDNLQMVGRNGMHKYNNQDHSMLTAMLSAENILGANHDLWTINVEQEYHEEKVLEPGEEAALDKLLPAIFSRMDQLGLATAIGSVCGLLTFLATIWLVMKGGAASPYLRLLDQYFFGFTVTVKGAFIGMAYSFSWGFLSGWLFAYLRNFSVAYYIYRIKRKAELLTFRDFLDHF
ncbi:MAG TPA: NAD(P)/FAD-dependent oxidoreductase [Thermodesulfobacteriota bacterium]|nr:NAD(P)/FAD-dependent oxidoreductase [Thermodesulfobacteriota bacterium]